MVLPDSPVAGRRATESGTELRGRGYLSRRPEAVPRERLVTLRTRCSVEGTGKNSRSGCGREAIRQCLGRRRREAHVISLLTTGLFRGRGSTCCKEAPT